jgi:hypothetical protein
MIPQQKEDVIPSGAEPAAVLAGAAASMPSDLGKTLDYSSR